MLFHEKQQQERTELEAIEGYTVTDIGGLMYFSLTCWA